MKDYAYAFRWMWLNLATTTKMVLSPLPAYFVNCCISIAALEARQRYTLAIAASIYHRHKAATAAATSRLRLSPVGPTHQVTLG